MAKINIKMYGKLHPYVFYHNDMDGRASAWQLHSHFEECNILDSPSDYQHYNYDGNMKLGCLNKSIVTYIVDLSFTEETLNTLIDICEKSAYVIWIDHHDSSLDLIKKHYELLQIHNLFIFVNKSLCGALLTHVYLNNYLRKIHPLEDNYNLFPSKTLHTENNYLASFEVFDFVPAKDKVCSFFGYKDFDGYEFTDTMNIPDWLEMVDDHDRHCLRNRNTRPFMEGINLENNAIVYKTIDNKIEFNSAFWNYLDVACYDYVNNGALIIRYRDKKASDELHQCFEWIEPETGAKIICKNDRGDSYVFLDLYNTYDAVCLFRFDGRSKRWFYSLYANNNSTFDCKEFCSRYGGGGHFHAAGFNTEKLIFDF